MRKLTQQKHNCTNIQSLARSLTRTRCPIATVYLYALFLFFASSFFYATDQTNANRNVFMAKQYRFKQNESI